MCVYSVGCILHKEIVVCALYLNSTLSVHIVILDISFDTKSNNVPIKDLFTPKLLICYELDLHLKALALAN
ncbi:hypothetical protein L1987_44626 [Smallanthus sonchifolius]|uniref:Uncharacterized protein n=1 Tax=Smallanthus sonchifolius TaxID=185202 RepID=A0ACB9GQ39_9ASTR|nr:hypothetical protein L1987_44626 [Smallanthus sonchifolius]